MKFNVGDRVRVIAWTVPATSVGACGQTGTVINVKDGSSADGPYKVRLDSGHMEWSFRPCDLVLEDSECTCSNTILHEPTGFCPVHDRPDPDPTAETAARLAAMIEDLSHVQE